VDRRTLQTTLEEVHDQLAGPALLVGSGQPVTGVLAVVSVLVVSRHLAIRNVGAVVEGGRAGLTDPSFGIGVVVTIGI
jgi:hypothetical protein